MLSLVHSVNSMVSRTAAYSLQRLQLIPHYSATYPLKTVQNSSGCSFGLRFLAQLNIVFKTETVKELKISSLEAPQNLGNWKQGALTK